MDGVSYQPAVELLQGFGDLPWSWVALADLRVFFLKNVILQSEEKLIYGDGKGITYSLLYGVVLGSKHFLRKFQSK